MRAECTQAHKAVRRAVRSGQPHRHLADRHRQLLHEYHKAIRAQKKAHWRAFLAEHANIWKAAQYLHPGRSEAGAKIAYLQRPNQERINDSHDIGQLLLETFFAPPRPRTQHCGQQGTPPGPLPRQPSAEPITAAEVRNAIFGAKPNKAPGPCDLPALVWQQLWPVLHQHLVELFQASVATGQVPAVRKEARIIPLRKLDRGLYAARRIQADLAAGNPW